MMDMNADNLESKSRDELASMARNMGLSHTDMDKDQLIAMIKQHKQDM